MTRVYNQTGKYSKKGFYHNCSCGKKFFSYGNAKYCWDCKYKNQLENRRRYRAQA